MESNHRPAVYETAALPTELRRLVDLNIIFGSVKERNLTQGMEALSMIETPPVTEQIEKWDDPVMVRT